MGVRCCSAICATVACSRTLHAKAVLVRSSADRMVSNRFISFGFWGLRSVSRRNDYKEFREFKEFRGALDAVLVFSFPFSVFRLLYSYKVYAVAEGENHALYPLVVQYMFVEGDNFLCLLVLAGNLLHHLAVP